MARRKRIEPGKPLPRRPSLADIVRLLAKAIPGDSVPEGFMTPCWLWQGGTDDEGYGFIKIGGHKRWVNRVSHEVFIGPVPAGREVNHGCFNRACFNPEHLNHECPLVNRADTRRARKKQSARAQELEEVPF